MNFLTSILEDTLHLFYPNICNGCGNDNLNADQQICFHCFNDLPVTGFIDQINNATEKIFSGRLDIIRGHSEFYFSKGKIIQTLLHQLKYKGNKQTGLFLGELLGKSLLKSQHFQSIDCIIPVPMFPDKELKRGYNQASIIALRLSEIIQKPVFDNVVLRIRTTQSQTKIHRTERWSNVDRSFVVKKPAVLENKNILLIDDVVTTGATLEACGREILKVSNTKLSIATIAIATY